MTFYGVGISRIAFGLTFLGIARAVQSVRIEIDVGGLENFVFLLSN